MPFSSNISQFQWVVDICTRIPFFSGMSNSAGSCVTGMYCNLFFDNSNGGELCVQSSADDCILCNAGTFANVSGRSSCQACAVGTFQKLAGQASCSPCAPGSVSASSGSLLCTLCQPGMIAAAEGMTTCQPCPNGTLQLNEGGTACSSCPSAYSMQPAAVLEFVPASVCASFQHVVVVSWGVGGSTSAHWRIGLR